MCFDYFTLRYLSIIQQISPIEVQVNIALYSVSTQHQCQQVISTEIISEFIENLESELCWRNYLVHFKMILLHKSYV